MSGDGVFINLWLPAEWEEPMAQLIESFSTPYTSPEDVAHDALVHLVQRRLLEIEAVGEQTSRQQWWQRVTTDRQDYINNEQ